MFSVTISSILKEPSYDMKIFGISSSTSTNFEQCEVVGIYIKHLSLAYKLLNYTHFLISIIWHPLHSCSFVTHLRLSVAFMYIGQVWEELVARWDDAPPSSAVSSLDHKRDRWEKLVGTLSSSFPCRIPLRESSLDFPPRRMPLQQPIRESLLL